MEMPERTRSALFASSFVLIGVGMLGFGVGEALEASYARQTVEMLRTTAPGAFFSAPGRHVPTFELVADFVAPLGFALLVVIWASRALPHGCTKRVTAALLIVAAAGIISIARPLFMPPSHDMVVWSSLQFALYGSVCVSLLWERSASRWFAITGATFLVIRQVALFSADDLFVQATGDPGSWPLAEAWTLGAHAAGIAAAFLLAVAFLLSASRRRESDPVHVVPPVLALSP